MRSPRIASLSLVSVTTLSLALAAPAPPARAELLDEALRLQQRSVTYGTGTTRLDAMGLRLATRDENDEINLFDYGDNPAGLLGDRDSWSVDTRFSHEERFERNPLLPGNRYKSNVYSFLGSARTANGQAFGGGIDYIQSSLEPREQPRTDFTNSRLRFIYSRQVGRFAVGGEFRALSEREDLRNSSDIYPIHHDTSNFTGVLGLSFAAHEHVTLAARGLLRQTTVDGLAAGDSHSDKFTWDRPSGTAEGQAYINFPNLSGAAVFQRTKGAGEEKLNASWSQLFVFNPTTGNVNFERRTFTEELRSTGFRTRWRYDIKPDFLTLAASFDQNNQTAVTRKSEVTLGSRQDSDIELDYHDFGVGAGLHLAQDRVFLGGELHTRSDGYKDRDPFTGFENKLTTTTLSVGGEYLAVENLAARAGLAFGTDDRNFDQGLSGTFTSSSASIGFGVISAGGILQLDAAYSVGLSSQLDVDQNHFSMYARLLF